MVLVIEDTDLLSEFKTLEAYSNVSDFFMSKSYLSWKSASN